MPTSNRYFYRHRGYEFPTVKYLKLVHDTVLEESGGGLGIADEGKIISAARQPVQSAGGEDAYPTLFWKVAAVGLRLAHDHSFTDANKRTALQVMLDTLERNDYYAAPSEEEATTIMVLTAMGLLEIEGLRIALMLWCGVDPADHTA